MKTRRDVPIILLAGPTASGKSALALDVAQKIGAVIINADAMQVYRDLNVLTARPSAEDEALAPHRLYGFLPSHEASSAGKWLRWAKMEIDWALSAGKPALVVGGTGLYLKTLLEGIADIPDVSDAVRTQAESDWEAMGAQAFHDRLCWADPVLGPTLKPGDKQRNIRAYAVWLETAKPLSWWQEQGKDAPYPDKEIKVFQMDVERRALYARADARFEAMMEHGAVEEVEALLALKLPASLPVMRAVGVPEISAWINGEISKEEAVAKAQQATRNYIKRQQTWLRHQLPQAVSVAKPEEMLVRSF